MTVGHLIAQAQTALTGTLGFASVSARIEAQALLRRALGDVSRAWLITHEYDSVAPEQQAIFKSLLIRRLAGEPVAYILGEREFFGLMFRVTPATLIPRPETELLVELALQRMPSLPLAGGGGQQSDVRVLDLGTGCGAIALSIAHARPDAEVVAVDASAAALGVAYENAKRLLQSGSGELESAPESAIRVANLSLQQSDWFEQLATQHFDLIVSNPPYVAAHDPHLQQGDLRFEPLSALASGDDGLNDIRRIIAKAPGHLHRGGWLMFEHGHDQATAVRSLLQAAGFMELFSARDLAGIERVSGGQLA